MFGFNSITIDYSEKTKEKTTNGLIEIVNERDPTYSPLSLYFIIDNNLIADQTRINQLFDMTNVPVIASHSSCRKFTPGWERNMGDKEIIRFANQTDTILVFSKTRHFRH